MTRRQLQLLRFICGYQQAKGYSPSFEEMRDALGASDKKSMFWLIDHLLRTGHIGFDVLRPVPIPRDPDGKPLYFVAIGEGSDA